MLKKKAEDKTRLQEKLQNYAKKIKDLEKQLQHVPTAATQNNQKPLQQQREALQIFLHLKSRACRNLPSSLG
jgi:hypothetical protein